MIPVEVIRPTQSAYSFTIHVNSLDDLMPAKHPGLDVICNGILSGRDFIYEHEKF
jgi:hypothetical protein